ncbi:MAG: hypothetical protein EA397_18120 [Deltaproteobacteria bacterium]|nr:MAG: hypothetical protein EA397_18120 [Deltaproteobacteria bacterium]
MDLPVPKTWSEAAEAVIPLLRPPTSPANAWLVGLDKREAQLLRRPLAPFLDVVIALDLPELRLFVNRGHLEAWRVPEAEVFAAALHNLPPPKDLSPWPEADGVWALEEPDGQASARLALPGWLRALSDKMRGQPVAVAPDARTLWVSGTEAGLPLQRMIERAWERYHSAGTPVSPTPLTLGPRGALEPWRPGPGQPLVHKIDAAARFQAGAEYRNQQAPLEAWLLDHDQPTYLASYHLLRHQGGRVASFACWPDGPTLLPEVDLVYLGPPGEGLLERGPTLPMAALRAVGVIGAPEPLLAPPRTLVAHHPDLRHLRNLAVDPRRWSPHDPHPEPV